MIVIILIIVAGGIIGLYYYTKNKPNYNSITCEDACKEKGYASGLCKWASEASENEEDVGSNMCFLHGTKHCGSKGACNCYCSTEPLIGGCAGVASEYLQECCDSWASENNFVVITCVGVWVIEDNECKWECGSEGKKIVELGEEFILGKNQTAEIKDEGLKIKIIEFYNYECPPNAECIWSGIGIEFEYYYNGETKKGMNLVQAFGYQTNIIDTDYKTYANLSITKI